MKLNKTLKLILFSTLVIGGLLSSAWTTSSEIIVASGSGGGPHVRIFDGSSGSLDESSEQADDFVDEGSASDDEQQAISHSAPEWKYIPVRR